MTAAILMLPVVHEVFAGEGGSRLTVEDFRFAVRERPRHDGQKIEVAHAGATLRYVRRDDGTLWCPFGGPGAADVGAADAGAALRTMWDETRRRSTAAAGPGHSVLSPLRMGMRSDGRYYRCDEAKPWPPRRRMPGGDREARFAAMSTHVAGHFEVVAGTVWRRCTAPAIAAAMAVDDDGEFVAAAFLPEGLRRSGAAAIWDSVRFGGREDLARRLSAMRGVRVRARDLPEMGGEARRLLRSDHDHVGANIVATDAFLRASMHEYLPSMAEDAFELWMAVREAADAVLAGCGDPAGFFVALKDLARRQDVGHDAPSAAARGRWHLLISGMKLAVARHEIEDRELAAT